MPASFFHAGRSRLLSIAGCICLLALTGARVPAAPQHGGAAHTPFEKAQRMREALEGRPERQRTRRDYERVIEAYRVIYHGEPASPKADASVSAVGDLLAEEGRVFQDEKALHDAIAQYEFLRKEYPGSRYRFSALLTKGEIYLRDLNDRESARVTFQEFLKLYPQNPLANEARVELTNLRKGPGKTSPSPPVAQEPAEGAGSGSAPTKRASAGHRTVLTAAIQSQDQGAPASHYTTSSNRQGSSANGSATNGAPGNTAPAKTSPAPATQSPEQSEPSIAESDIPPPP